MYRNCVYNNREKTITLFTWDAQGNRVREELDYSPYIYLEDKKGLDTSIYGTSLKKKEFQNSFERNKFVKESSNKRIFENLPPAQQFLIDNYWMDCEKDEFSQYPLKVMFLDIETYSKEFPDVQLATHTINLITIYDSFSKKYVSFGLKPYTPERKDHIYHYCQGEEKLLKEFLKYYRNDPPDVLVGWNNVGFDIPYTVNRITNVLGEDYARDLSPVQRYYEKVDKTAKFGTPQNYYVLEGVSSLDYMVMYKKFALEPQESYKLDYIAEVELEKNKIQYEGQLWELADNDWKKFVEYNVQDVELLVNLDDKLRYIELLRFISYLGLCSMEQAVKTLAVINGAVAVRARQRGERIPTFVRTPSNETIPGGYVTPPIPGYYESIVTFDANSLYPSVMLTLNLSPETKLGRVEKINDDKINIHHVSGKTYELTAENFKKYMVSEKASMAKNKFIFSQKKKGIMPEFLDFLYTKRKEMKKEMASKKKYLEQNKESMNDEEIRIIKSEISRCNTFQHAYKITLNSTYGYCANKYAPLGDLDIATSITLTGQAVKHKNNEVMSEFLQSKGISKEEAEKSQVYGDTDSYVAETEIVTNKGIFDAESLWENYDGIEPSLSSYGHEIISVENADLQVRTFDSYNEKVKWGKVKNLIRHKVSKKKYKIKVDGKEIIMTEDHGCMVYRNGNLIQVKPSEILKTDKMVVYSDT